MRAVGRRPAASYFITLSLDRQLPMLRNQMSVAFLHVKLLSLPGNDC